MFDDHPSRKQAFLDYTNIDSKQWPYWDFFRGVNPWFWSKSGNFIFACFKTKRALEKYHIMSDDHLVKKQVLLDYQNMDFYTAIILYFFSKGVSPWYRYKKTEFFSVCWPSSNKTSLSRLKKYGFYKVAILRFFQRETYDFRQKLQISP